MNKKINEKIPLNKLDYFFVLRPMLFFPGWSTLLAGYLITYKTKFYLSFETINSLAYFDISLLFISFAMIMGSTFILNQLVDKESDKINSKLFLISKNHISNKNAIAEVILLIVVGLTIGYFVNVQIFVLFLVFLILTGYLYNFRPFQFKNNAFMSIVSNALMGWLAFAIGWSMNSDFNMNLIIDSLPYLFFNIALYLFTTLPDIDGDKSIKKNTIAVKYGHKAVILFAFFIYGLGIIVTTILDDKLSMIYYWLSLPLFLLTIFTFKISHTLITTKLAILFFALAICLKIPYYIIVMVFGFYATKLYFKNRFNLDYPNFLGR